MDSCEDLRRRAALLRTAPGVGPVSATALIAQMPELGTCTSRQVAALAGLAPMARDSGLRTGKPRIGGGRKSLRDVLYMAGLGWPDCGANRSLAARSLRQAQSKRQSTRASHHRRHTQTAYNPQRNDPRKQAVSNSLIKTLAPGEAPQETGGWPPCPPPLPRWRSSGAKGLG
ncbi:MAG: transposase [Pseudomonadota bacterium]